MKGCLALLGQVPYLAYSAHGTWRVGEVRNSSGQVRGSWGGQGREMGSGARPVLEEWLRAFQACREQAQWSLKLLEVEPRSREGLITVIRTTID